MIENREQYLRALHEKLAFERLSQCSECGKPSKHDVEGVKFCHHCYLKRICCICRVQVRTLDTWQNKPIHPTCFYYEQRKQRGV